MPKGRTARCHGKPSARARPEVAPTARAGQQQDRPGAQAIDAEALVVVSLDREGWYPCRGGSGQGREMGCFAPQDREGLRGPHTPAGRSPALHERENYKTEPGAWAALPPPLVESTA